ncbi:MAG: hypothetical protein KBA30_04165 [Clostridia bacterium]|nr:hypothetical protein [Clostridia bacterium]
MGKIRTVCLVALILLGITLAAALRGEAARPVGGLTTGPWLTLVTVSPTPGFSIINPTFSVVFPTGFTFATTTPTAAVPTTATASPTTAPADTTTATTAEPTATTATAAESTTATAAATTAAPAATTTAAAVTSATTVTILATTTDGESGSGGPGKWITIAATALGAGAIAVGTWGITSVVLKNKKKT